MDKLTISPHLMEDFYWSAPTMKHTSFTEFSINTYRFQMELTIYLTISSDGVESGPASKQ